MLGLCKHMMVCLLIRKEMNPKCIVFFSNEILVFKMICQDSVNTEPLYAKTKRSDCYSYSPVIEKKWMNSCKGTAVQIMLSHRYRTLPNEPAQVWLELIVTHFHLRKINTELWAGHLLRSRHLNARCELTPSAKEPIFGSDYSTAAVSWLRSFTRQWEDWEVASDKKFPCS